MSAVLTDVVGEVARRVASPGAPPDHAAAANLIGAVLGLPTHWQRTFRPREFSATDLRTIDEACTRLLRGMPLAYATRRATFRTLDLTVDERVLIPRPETEVLVDVALEATQGGAGTAIDVGTGSGAIALAMAVEGGFRRIVATDVSAAALAVARENEATVRRQCAGQRRMPPVEFRHGSWLAPCRGERAELVIANPPYIAYAEALELPSSVRDWEPPVALFAGDDGMSSIAAVATGAAGILTPAGVLAIEVDSRRAGRAAAVVAATGAYDDVTVRPDLAGRARVVVARRRES